MPSKQGISKDRDEETRKEEEKNWVGNNVQRGVRKIRKNDLNVTCNKNRQTGRSQSRGRRFSKKGWEGGFSDQKFVTWDRGMEHRTREEGKETTRDVARKRRILLIKKKE